MKSLIIFRYIRDPRDNNKILGKRMLRHIRVQSSFVGIKERGVIDKSEFKRLADILEPSNDGFSIS